MKQDKFEYVTIDLLQRVARTKIAKRIRRFRNMSNHKVCRKHNQICTGEMATCFSFYKGKTYLGGVNSLGEFKEKY